MIQELGWLYILGTVINETSAATDPNSRCGDKIKIEMSVTDLFIYYYLFGLKSILVNVLVKCYFRLCIYLCLKLIVIIILKAYALCSRILLGLLCDWLA